ncbi:MAG: sialidase family protein [Verrucomicrobiota bacterium]|nr:sialidase family protein [Verrucomicrobiota bacterium]
MNKKLQTYSMRILIILFFLNLKVTAKEIPYIDLAEETDRQVIVDREKGQYLGHPTTTLLNDGKTVLCVYPKGHGRGPIVYKRSNDAGKTWSNRLPTPDNWSSSKEVPTLFQVTDKEGNDRIIMFSGLYPIRMAVSNDEGKNWTGLKPIGEFGGIVAMGTMISVKGKPGHYRALFHDDGRFI